MTAAGPPPAGQLAYYRVSWVAAPKGEPVSYWYEVDHDGNALRQIEIYPDGRAVTDDIDRYPDRASDFGFGTLHGAGFYDTPFEWPKAGDIDRLVLLDAGALEFEAVWNAVEQQ